MKFGLELLARTRQVSLSQACEFAIGKVLRNEEFEGASLLAIAEAVNRTIDEKGGEIVVHLDQRVLAALRLPEKLRTPEEQYVLEVFTVVRAKLTTDQLMDLYSLASRSFNIGLSVRDAARQLTDEPNQLQKSSKQRGRKKV